ncbi:MAG: hypothetical protein HOV87_03390 [Catenulispora sp.]|nr:hypothetical protein [Catenulispora sp.]
MTGVSARLLPGRRWCVVVATVLASTAVIAPARAASNVSCTYRLLAAWPGGFSADVSIANGGPTIDGWTVRWTFADATTVIQTWNSDLSELDARVVTATNRAWNRFIPTGTVTSFGWTAQAVSTAVPTDLSVNGLRC